VVRILLVTNERHISVMRCLRKIIKTSREGTMAQKRIERKTIKVTSADMTTTAKPVATLKKGSPGGTIMHEIDAPAGFDARGARFRKTTKTR
jgi:hypothetical protein